MKLTSPAFEDGEHMPEKHGYDTENVNPPLRIEDVPEDAKSLVLIMDDPDAMEPAGKVWDHWTVWNIDPSTREIGEGGSPGVEGTTDFGDTGYGGPSPPDGTHTYVFTLYAIDTELELDSSAMKEDVLEEIEGQVIEKTTLEGLFDPL